MNTMNNEDPADPSVHEPRVLDAGVGRLGPERDQEGPRGTYGCACVSDSARLCTLLRYDRDMDSREQHDDDCECLCHQWSDDDEDFWYD